MAETSWRDYWPPFRVALVDETARCLADQQSTATAGQRPRWADISSVQQNNLTENIAGVFVAQDQAMHNLAERGLPF
ncbi:MULTISPECIES: hypothetical protein [unclassified Cryobacterium]|uniref:hypothetical protein n=1 Tax=unclassified Cryobacterium TaxID=2649013 RepID=UPI002AB3F437|nr:MULTISPECIES: hypothetical protein [unclassified Cryobacterium]MDY7528121.1 hypothetical protein [Cryobacterium sp. 10C2]MDY7556130.1 hypothetical protein [Cryobacterium sp. 10C3]MEB0290074.1 hypothetical protein [Cryobacterium sp. 10C2]